jgi:tetratricopeptide (TPR) repeat protein
LTVQDIEEAIEDGNFAQADQTLDAAVEESGWTPLLRVLSAEIAFESEDFEGCLERVAEHLDAVNDPGMRAELLTFRAYSLFYLDREDQARTAFNRAVGEDNSLWAALLGRAMVHEHLGYLQAALIDLDRAIELDDQEAEPFAIRGSVYLQFGEPREAMRDLGWAVEIDPYDDESRLDLARLKALDDQNEEAMELLDPLVEEGVEPMFVMPAALLRSQMALALGSTTPALKDAERAIEVAPDEPWGYLQKAAALLTAGSPGDAVAALNEAEERADDPRDLPDIDAMKASAYEQLGKPEKAARHRDKVSGSSRLPAVVYGEQLDPTGHIPMNPNRPVDVRRVLKEVFGDPEDAPEGYADKVREVLDRVPEMIEENPDAPEIEVELPPIEPGGESPGEILFRPGQSPQN